MNCRLVNVIMMKATGVGVWVTAIFIGSFLQGNAAGRYDAAADTAEFTLVKTSGDIALYERWITPRPNQKARQVKATFTLRASPAAAVALLKDGSRGRMWNKNTNSYEVVEVSEDSWIGYIQYDLPWPISNQDCVLQYRATGSDESLVVAFEGTEHPRFPERKRVQRIAEIMGKWVFTKVDDDEVLVEYYITTHPSKTLPGWITDPIIRNNLIETVGAFRAMLENDLSARG